MIEAVVISGIIFLSLGLLLGRLGRLRSRKETPAEDELSEEVRDVLSQCSDKDAGQEKAMLKSILDLTDVTVYDVMNHRKNLFALDIDTPVEQILEKVKNSPFSRIPLYRNRPENIVGVIRVKTLFREIIEQHNNFQNIKIENIMTKPWFIPDNTTLMQQLQLFRARREHFAIVVDEYGVLQGIVTLEDILEEIALEFKNIDTNIVMPSLWVKK